MKRKLAACTATVLLLCSMPAWAHRIDEYLQATILSLGSDRAHASMRLIPGVMVAPSVIAMIDANHDGVFSENEKRAYADRVLGDLFLSIDGQAVELKLDSWSIPDASQLRDGLGEIHLEYHVDLPPSATTNRRLVLTNRHLNETSVYLVNVEVPEDLTLRIVGPEEKPAAVGLRTRLSTDQHGSRALQNPAGHTSMVEWGTAFQPVPSGHASHCGRHGPPAFPFSTFAAGAIVSGRRTLGCSGDWAPEFASHRRHRYGIHHRSFLDADGGSDEPHPRSAPSGGGANRGIDPGVGRTCFVSNLSR